jgi:hypothetical protein
MLCALGTNDLEKAREVFHRLPEAAQNETLTRYLMYKVAVRCAERELATECLGIVARESKQDQNLLYACVLDAQEAGDKRCAVEALKVLILRHEHHRASDIHVPALFRCTVRLLCSVLKSEEEDPSGYVDATIANDLCVVFEEGRLPMDGP